MGIASNASTVLKNNASLRKHHASYLSNKAYYQNTVSTSKKGAIKRNVISEEEKLQIQYEVNLEHKIRKIVVGLGVIGAGIISYFMFV